MYIGEPTIARLRTTIYAQYNHILFQFGQPCLIIATIGFFRSFCKSTTAILSLCFITWSGTFALFSNFHPNNRHHVEAMHQMWIIPNCFIVTFIAQGLAVAVSTVTWGVKKCGQDLSRFYKIIGIVLIAYMANSGKGWIAKRTLTSDIFKVTTLGYLKAFPKGT